ncbi:MAG: CPBP family intramembrane metalloprotease [Coriobacteriaceae bacterium]|nr:CPBP family intramembrane metalloprotease [Coriobacteriaceae bacterium]
MIDETRNASPVPPAGCPNEDGAEDHTFLDGLESQGPVGLGHKVKWIAAMAGVFLLFIVVQVAALPTLRGLSAGFHAIREAETYALETGEAPSEAEIARLQEEGLQSSLDSSSVEGQMVEASAQLVVLGVMYLMWHRVRKRGFVPPRAPGFSKRTVYRIFAGLAIAGMGFQFTCSTLLTLIVPFFEGAFAEYDALMQPAVGDAAYVEFISIVILAPVLEEMCCRGVMLEFGLRALRPWSSRTGACGVDVPSKAFWLANFLQASAFAVLHLNVIQGSYALVLGMVFGYVYWRTGKLRYPIALHAAVNASSYLINVPASMLPPRLSILAIGVLGIALLALAWRLLKSILATQPSRGV